jgi:acyl carrier protein
MASRQADRDALIEFLGSIARPGQSLEDVGDQDNLVDSGIIDSLSVIQIILYLETTHGVNFRALGVDPAEVVSIQGMLQAAGHGQ